MKFKIDPTVFEKFPNLIVALPVITGFDNTKNSKKALDLLREIEMELREKTNLPDFLKDPRVTSYVQCFKEFGTDPEKFRPAHVALAVRVLEGGNLPDINPMVNLYNAMSLKYITPFGGENLEAVYGDFVLKFAEGGEQWIPIGGGKSKPATKGELVWSDDFDLSTRALNWRQCDRTKMTDKTTTGYYVMDGFEDINKENIEKAAVDFCETATKLFGGEAKIYWLDKAHPEVDIPFKSKEITKETEKTSITKKPEHKVEARKAEYKKGTNTFELAQQIAAAVNAAFPEAKISLEEINLEHPTVEDHGDYSTNIALKLAKQLGQNPHVIAEKISDNLKNSSVAGPGFINITLTPEFLAEQVTRILKEKDAYGSSDVGKGQTVIVDYSAPNIAKPFGIGHLRSTIIGQAIYNSYKALGYKTVGDNHLGDWGTQFGKLLYMIDMEKPKELSIEKLEELYVKFHKLAEENKDLEEKARSWFKKLEDGDKKARELWQKCVDISMLEFNRIYDLLNVKIDYAYGEAFYEEIMPGVIEEAKKKKVARLSDGAWVIDIPGQKAPLMLVKSDGGTTYATRDLATLKFRKEKFNPDIVVYEVGGEQALHFVQLFSAARMLGYVKETTQLIHTKHGLYLAPDGKKFSTRKGKTVKLEEVLLESVQRAKKLGSETDKMAKAVGIGAVKYFDLKHNVQSDIVFDWEKMFALEGDSGPYIQYTYARAKSVLQKATGQKGKAKANDINSDELVILRWIYRFPEIVEVAAKTFSPNLICSYLFELAKRFNSFYATSPILENDFRLALTEATSIVLKNGLTILGIEAPEKM